MPAMWETRVPSLGWEDPLEKEMATHSIVCFSVFLPGEFHGRRSLVGYSPPGRKESDTTERLHFHFHFHRESRKMVLKNYLQGSNGETDMNRLVDMGRGEERVRCMERVTWKLTLA